MSALTFSGASPSFEEMEDALYRLIRASFSTYAGDADADDDTSDSTPAANERSETESDIYDKISAWCWLCLKVLAIRYLLATSH